MKLVIFLQRFILNAPVQVISSRAKKPERFCIRVETQGKFHIGLKLSFHKVKHRYPTVLPPVQKSSNSQPGTLPWKRGTRWFYTYKCSPEYFQFTLQLSFLTLTLILQQETKQVLGCTGRSVASRPRKVILLPLHPAFVRSYLQSCAQFWAPQYKVDRDLLQQFHLMPWGPEHMMYKKRPEQPGWFSLKKQHQMGKSDWCLLTTCLEDAEKVELGSSQRCDVIGQEAVNTHSCMGNSSQLIKSFHLMGGQSGTGTRVMETLSGHIETSNGQGHLVGPALSRRLQQRPLKASSNPSYSMFFTQLHLANGRGNKQRTDLP